MSAGAAGEFVGADTLSTRIARALADRGPAALDAGCAGKAKLCLLDYLSCAPNDHRLGEFGRSARWSRLVRTAAPEAAGPIGH